MMWVPTIGASLNVMLPGEIMRGEVTRVIGRDVAFVTIGQPMTKSHNYRKGDTVAARRTPGVLGETWQAIEHRPDTVPPVIDEVLKKRPSSAKQAKRHTSQRPRDALDRKPAAPR